IDPAPAVDGGQQRRAVVPVGTRIVSVVPVPGRVMVVTTVSELADAGVGPAVVRSHHLEPGPYGAGGTADLVLGDTDRPAQPGQTRRSEVTDLPASQSQPSLPGGS